MIVVVLDYLNDFIGYDEEFAGDPVSFERLLQKDIQYCYEQVKGGHTEFGINEEVSLVERLNCAATEY